MNWEIIDFDSSYLKNAAKLLQRAQENQFENLGIDYKASIDFCEQKIVSELEKEVSSSYLLFSEKQLVGYAIAVIERDSIWGNSGWVNRGGWCIHPDFMITLPYLYQKIAEKWVEYKIGHHHFMIFDREKQVMDLLSNLGFAKQQTYGIKDISQTHDFTISGDSFVYRKSRKSDQSEMTHFSRLIAEYQNQSPCFAGAPQKYLEALDKGFSEITYDTDIDLYVIEDGSELAGYQGFYDMKKPDLIFPENTVELAVTGVKEEYRGKGCGINLTKMALSAQRDKGFQYALTDWRCANLLSSNFWIKMGFVPLAHRLFRQIDSRVMEKG